MDGVPEQNTLHCTAPDYTVALRKQGTKKKQRLYSIYGVQSTEYGRRVQCLVIES